MKQQRSAGFTIVELLIATVVFSVILLVISAAIVQIGRLYHKGMTNARTQEAARLVMSDIAEAIQFNAGDIVYTISPSNGLDNQGSRAICIANRHISYKLGQQRTDQLHAVVERKIDSGCQSVVAQNLNLTSGIQGNELLGDKMRLANLVVEPVLGDITQFRVVVRVVYGDRDLLCDASASAGVTSCNSPQSIASEEDIAAIRPLACKNIRSGSQFCATSELSTIVKRRLVGNL